VLFLLGRLLFAQTNPGFPFYSAESIANTAANVTNLYAANTFITIYGNNLATNTRGLRASDVQNGVLPYDLPGTGVTVLLSAQPANVYYVSPTQINVLIPSQFRAGTVNLQVVVNGRAGPKAPLTLEESAPALFEDAERYVIATHADGSVISADSPAARGEIVVLYATGLGPVLPALVENRIPQSAAWLERLTEFEVRFNGTPVARDRILYAGAAPGFAGLYQINVRLPEDVGDDPGITVRTGQRMSPPGRFLRVR
jgi:uncharacterized protein (TIGR03437 family)